MKMVNKKIIWAIWKDFNSDFVIGPKTELKNNQLIEEFQDYSEAIKVLKFYKTLFAIKKI